MKKQNKRLAHKINKPKKVARTGFEPVISALRGRRPKPLDERAGVKIMENVRWKK